MFVTFGENRAFVRFDTTGVVPAGKKIIAATLFVIIRSFEELQKRRRGTEEALEEAPEDIVLLTEIRDLLAQSANNSPGPRPPVS